jgi:hypothetical protein
MPSVEEIDAVVGCMCAILGKNEAWKTGASSCIISVEDNAQAKNRQKAGKICPELPHALVEHEKFLKRANEMTEKYFDCRKIVKAEYRRSSLGLS